MGKKVLLIIAGAATVTAVSTTAALLGNGGAEENIESNDETTTDTIEQPQPTASEVSEQTEQLPQGTSSGTQSSTTTTDNTKSDATSVTIDNWLDQSSNKSKYFGSKMAFANATFSGADQAQDTLSDSEFNNYGFKQNGYVPSKYKGAGQHIKTNLIITVDRKQYGNNSNAASERKGTGKLTGFWSFVNTHTKKGFITFNQARTDATQGKLVLTGYFYLLKQENNENKGKVIYKKEVKDSDGKVLDKTSFYQYFPKPYWYTPIGGFDKMYYTNGDFINSGEELNGTMATICDENSSDNSKKCSGSPTKTIKQEGEGEGVSGQGGETGLGWGEKGHQEPYLGSGNHNNNGGVYGYDFMYGDDKFDLYKQLDSFYLGTGKVKDGKGFRRSEDGQQLRGDNPDGWAV